MNSWKSGLMLVLTLAILMLVASNATWATPQYFQGTGHYYDVIADFTGISWSEARLAAGGQIWQGNHGYLACITSAEENQFVFNLSLRSNIWHPYTIWYVGPWLGGFQQSGSVEPDGGWTWVSGEPISLSNWLSGQPDNNGWQGQNEDSLVFWGRGEITPTWNDYVNDPPDLPEGSLVYGYVVEFEGPATGACCLSEEVCLQGTEADCRTAGGNYVGDGVPCDPDPCGPTPTKVTSWGQVKALYK